MPSGKTHALTTTLVAGIAGSGLFLIGGESLARSAAFAGGCLVGLLINPDLDVRRPTYSSYLVRHSAGWLMAWLWSMLWWPYAHLIVPHHRHPISHLPVVGTLIRVVYLGVVVALAGWVLGLLLPLPAPEWLFPRETWTWGLGGLVLVDALHSLMDWWWPFPLRPQVRKIKVF